MIEEIRKYEPQAGIVQGVPIPEEMGHGPDDRGNRPSGPEVRKTKKKVAPNTIELKDIRANEVEPKDSEAELDTKNKNKVETPYKVNKTYQQENSPKEQDPIEQLSEDAFYKESLDDNEAQLFTDIFQFMIEMTNRETNIFKLAESPKLIPEIKKIEGEKPYWRVRLLHPDTNKIVESHRYKKLPKEWTSKLGGMALRDKWGPEHFKNIGKVGYKATVNKIQDMIKNPEKYPGTTEKDIEGLSTFLRRRLNQTTDRYRNQFNREWRSQMESLKNEQIPLTERKQLAFKNAEKAVFGSDFKPSFGKSFPKQYEGEQAHENIGLDNSKNKIGEKQEPITAKSLLEKMQSIIDKYEN